MLQWNKLFNFKVCFYSYQQQQKIRKVVWKYFLQLQSISKSAQRILARNSSKFFFTLVHLEAITEVSSSTIIIRLYNMTFFSNHGLFLDTSSVKEPSFVIKLALLLILGIECIVSKLLQYIPDNKRYFYRQFVSTLHLIDFFGNNGYELKSYKLVLSIIHITVEV